MSEGKLAFEILAFFSKNLYSTISNSCSIVYPFQTVSGVVGLSEILHVNRMIWGITYRIIWGNFENNRGKFRDKGIE